jgi:hypothetical protein
MKNKKNFFLLNFLTFFLFFFSIFFFFYGFIYEENAAGAGGFKGDFGNSWITLQTFLNNDIFKAIKTSAASVSDQGKYISSRPPLIWILNKFLNPFTDNKIDFLRSIFLFSLTAPILFYLCLKIKFPNVNKGKLILLSSTILLSPYFRTSSYWGLEENYGIIFILISYLSFNTYLKEKKICFVKYLKLFILTFLSSLCVYLDQKLLIIPLYFFFKIFFSKESNFLKLSTILFYFIFALPYVYLIILWGNIIPTADSLTRGTGVIFHFSHVGFSLTIIGFYLIPFFLFKEESVKYLLKSYLKNNKSLLFLLFTIFYFFISFFYDNYQYIQYSHLGKGIVHKLSVIIFSDLRFQKFFVYVSFFFFYFIVTIFLNRKVNESLIIFYFIFTSIFIHPLQQEYFDPLLLIMFFIFFNFKLTFYYKNIFILYFYHLFFLLIAKSYYLKSLPFIF